MDEEFLQQLYRVMERIALTGDLQPIPTLMEMTAERPQSPLLSDLAEAFARMLVKIEAREFQLECTIEDLTRVKAELELANYDPLTGLPNRVIAADRLRQGITRAKREERQLAVLYLDLDNFKWVNDNLGHPAGDELLQQVAERLRDCLREVDTVSRHGGDEFLVVLHEVKGTEAVSGLAARIVDSLARPLLLSAGEVAVTVSIGIALFPEHGESREVLLARADQALYQAKKAGRNRYAFFTP